jgi:hypothetical protein
MTSEMELVVDAGGDVRCVYGEELDLREIGKLQITRASHVEPDAEGYWWADMGPVGGPFLGPFQNRRRWGRSGSGWWRDASGWSELPHASPLYDSPHHLEATNKR